MEITQKAIILERCKNDLGQRCCVSSSSDKYFSCDLVRYFNSIHECTYSHDQLYFYEDSNDIKPSEFCPMWSEE